MENLRFSILFFLFFFLTGFLLAQEKSSHFKQSYTELNAGFASNRDWQNGLKGLPGASFLYGKTHYYKSGFIIDNEIGVALPVLLTAKIGGGFVINKTEILMGIRIFPMNYYTQINFPASKGRWVVSLEKFIPSENSVFPNTYYSFGYRWIK